jgi:hypothetical protein
MEMRKRRSSWILLAAFAFSVHGFADTTRYSAGGFEPPAFSPGRLAGLTLGQGQDDWIATGDGFFVPNLDGIVVQSSVVKNGQFAVMIDAAVQPQGLEFCHTRRNAPFIVPSTEPLVDVSLDFYLTDGTNRSEQWALDIQGNPLHRLTLWMISRDNRVLFFEDTGWVDTGYDIVRGVWYTVHTVMDYNAGSVRLYFDGSLIHTGSIITNFWEYGFASIKFNNPGNDRMYVDNYLVRSFSSPTSVGHSGTLPEDFSLGQNYPNPFNPTTTINYTVAKASFVTLTVFNLLGQEVHTVVSRAHEAGSYRIGWNGTLQNGSQAPSGVYLYQMRAGEFRETRRMVLAR